jgi:vitamin B12 transporter
MSSHHRRLAYKACLLALVLTLPARAQTTNAGAVAPPIPTPQSPADASPPVPTQTMATIVVTAATREAQAPESTAATTTVLTGDDLEQGRFADVVDALQTVPGLAVVASGNQGAETSIFTHGLNSNQTLVTIDGRRQAGGLSGADDNLTNLTLDNVDQIEVVRTPVSSLDGGSAMGGVINIVTLSGRDLAQPQGSVSFEAGSFDTFRESAQSRGAAGNFDYAVAASRQDSSFAAYSPGSTSYGFTTPGYQGQADQYRNTTLRGNFGYQVSPDIYVDLHAAYSDAYTSSPGIYLTPDPTASLLIEDWNLSPEVVAKVTDFFQTKFYLTHDQQRQADNDPFLADELISYGSSPQGSITRLQIDTDSVDWQNDFEPAHNWKITAGLQGDNRGFYEFDNVLGYRTLNGHDNDIGGYISSQWEPLPGLNILDSGRYDCYSQFDGNFSWRQGASYLIAPTKTVVHASVSSAYTPPPLQDLYVYNAGSPGYGPFLPNPSLQPETDLGCEVGVEQPLWNDRITPSVTYFHNDVQHAIENVRLNDGAFINENLNHVTTDGVEIGLKLRPWSTVEANLNYTYLDAVDNSTQLRLVRRPRNTLVATGSWTPLPPLTLTMGATWIVGRQDLDALSGAQEEAPDYFVIRASVNYRWNEHVTLWVRGENLTDRSYQPALGYLATGQAVYGGVKVAF